MSILGDIPIEYGNTYNIKMVLNHTLCPICGHRLYWDVDVAYHDRIDGDVLVFNSSCCGKDFKGIQHEDMIEIEEEE
ncbi:MAG: hypothetical protein DRQ78_11785 [Epsilonproteobacteria bacterium]|nr:MAG: hypothetical protein DRQ78_11785 [Campylobacterota bacterium]